MISVIPVAMTGKIFFRLSLIALCAPVLAACGLGYNKNPPDEFNVVRRAPLILPPEFNLRPPSIRLRRWPNKVPNWHAYLFCLRRKMKNSPMMSSSAYWTRRHAAAFMVMVCAICWKASAQAKPAKRRGD